MNMRTTGKKWRFGGIGIISALILFSACTPEKKLKETEFLLVRNKIVADNKAVPISDRISYVVQPRTNKRSLGIFLSKVSTYQAMIPVERPRYEKFKYKMRNTFGKYPVLLDTVACDWYAEKWNNAKIWIQKNYGEPPVLLDTGWIEHSVNQINLMMKKIGYFNAHTDYSVRFRGKRAVVLYKITAGTPYRITDIQYSVVEPVARIVLADTSNSLLQRGDMYNEYNLDDERVRIEERLLNRGYFNFSRGNVRYEADTSLGNGNVSLRVIIQNQTQRLNDSTAIENKFRCYKIQSIDIYANDSNLNRIHFDTVLYTEVVNKTDTHFYRVFFPVGNQFYKPSALVYPLFFATGDVLTKRRSTFSYDRYVDMRNFDYIKMSYAETEESRANPQKDTAYLHSKVELIKMKRQLYEFDLGAKNTGGIYGVGGSATYGNRNLFKRAEIFSFSMKYTQELQVVNTVWHFRNFEAGANVTLEFPRFLFPVKQQNIPKNFRPKTFMSAGFNYIQHDYYSRFLTSANFTYNWMKRLNSGKFIYHTLSPGDFGLIKMYKDSIIINIIKEYGFGDRIKERYKNHFMLGSKYGFTLQSGQYIFRAQFNAYGNVLYGVMRSWDSQTKKTKNQLGQYTVWKIPFESCLTADFDFVYNLIQQKRKALVYRLAVGVGTPTFHSLVIPYEKSFYLGGSNSMRAWRLRALGPGSFTDTSILERVGDIKFETNLEFRTTIYRYFKLGAFTDIGNIWLIKKSKDYPNGEFAFNRFYKELAIDVGLGLRIDLSFVIIRIDYALKIHDPAKQKFNGWQTFNWASYKNFKADRAIVFGIGYPF